jgi:excisionase family DNA binding protein
VAFRHFLDTSAARLDLLGSSLDLSGTVVARIAHLSVMDTQNPAVGTLEVLSLAELADRLHVTAQTLYDLRKKGRGPRGFRVGSQLKFRVSEVETWLSGLEQADDEARRRRRER